jgi:hypothetical protein
MLAIHKLSRRFSSLALFVRLIYRKVSRRKIKTRGTIKHSKPLNFKFRFQPGPTVHENVRENIYMYKRVNVLDIV